MNEQSKTAIDELGGKLVAGSGSRRKHRKRTLLIPCPLPRALLGDARLPDLQLDESRKVVSVDRE
jgi:hypothetical protein